MNNSITVAVIGAGAAGLMAAGTAAQQGARVLLFERNEKVGRKLAITGKGRCNVTNNCDMQEFLTHVPQNPRFLYSALGAFSIQDTMKFFEELGVPLKTERGNRVFPQSDKARDIVDALFFWVKRCGVTIVQERVTGIQTDETGVVGVKTEGKLHRADRVIVATGGKSYPLTGSTGDGYAWAQELGHKVTPLRAALVPLVCPGKTCPRLQGLPLKNVTLTIFENNKKLYEGFGEMLFTHFGISGPLGLSASSYIGKALEQQPLKGYLNLKPALTEEQLDARILREFEENRNKQFRNVINSLFPAKLLPVMLSLGGIDPYKQVNAVSKAERQHFEELITHFPFTVTGTRGFREAIITQGGVSVKEIRPGTMEAKKKEGLYFVGEVLDLDALTGGFNLQIAWASAHAAAEEIRAKEEQE